MPQQITRIFNVVIHLKKKKKKRIMTEISAHHLIAI